MMNQTCKVCGEPAAGFHFGAFTCEGCKSFFGRSYNNLSSISECKNNGKCTIDKKNRTTCKACRLRKCYNVGMSKGGSRYGRRSNWFKIHCLLQEQQQQALEAASKSPNMSGVTSAVINGPFGDIAAAMAAQRAAAHLTMPAHQQTPIHQTSSLAYANYLPDMSGGSAAARPFIATNGLPFFNLMNPSPPSAFQVPPHLLFPSYHPATAYHHPSDLYKQRHSFDAINPIESAKTTVAATTATVNTTTPHNSHSNQPNSNNHDYMNNDDRLQEKRTDDNLVDNNRESPELCVAEDDDNEEITSLIHHNAIKDTQPNNIIHNPIPIRLTPKQQMPHHHHPISNNNPGHNENGNLSKTPPTVSLTPPSSTQSLSHSSSSLSSSSLSSSVASCSVSPVSVGSETLSSQLINERISHSNQESPIDLSMKTTTRSATTTPATTITSMTATSTGSDVSSEISEESNRSISHRRSYYTLNTDSEMSENSLDSINVNKRSKIDQNSGLHGNYNRSIFICV